ncbi:MAG: integrase core domain-containing protein [Woeseiaceae bacterium]
MTRNLKYRPKYPAQPFANVTEARQWVSDFVDWYNVKHRHSAIQFVTPAQRHAVLDMTILAKRQALYQAVKARHPERWSQETGNWQLVQVVYLNPNKTDRNETRNTLNKAA